MSAFFVLFIVWSLVVNIHSSSVLLHDFFVILSYLLAIRSPVLLLSSFFCIMSYFFFRNCYVVVVVLRSFFFAIMSPLISMRSSLSLVLRDSCFAICIYSDVLCSFLFYFLSSHLNQPYVLVVIASVLFLISGFAFLLYCSSLLCIQLYLVMLSLSLLCIQSSLFIDLSTFT